MGTRTASDIFNTMLQSEGMRKFIQTYNTGASALLIVSTLAVIIMIIFHIVKLAKSADNPKDRQEAISGLVICLISFAILGGIDAVYAIVVNTIMSVS